MYKNARVRFAPSPTGHLHIGGLRSAIFNWLFAKHNNGKFLIRIEDTDRDRSTKLFEDSILKSFEWINIQSEEQIIKQSDRYKEHKDLIEKLVAEGKAYRCFCTHKIEFEESNLEGGYSKYDRTCRDIKPSEEDLKRSYVVRFKLPDFSSDQFKFDDLVYGEISFPVDQFDDFIIARSDGAPMYNFVVVADDIYQKIDFVIRGQEHLVNTPKQILLYQAIGAKVPQFAHLPLILGPSGAKLSKREAAVSVLSYREEGFLPDALLNYLVRLGWSHGDQEIFSRDELIKFFTLSDVHKSGAIFDIKKLEWLNSVYIKEMLNQEIINYIIEWIEPEFVIDLKSWSEEQILSFVALYKERVKTLKELILILKDLYLAPENFNEEDLKPWRNEETSKILKTVETELSGLISWNLESVKAALKKVSSDLNVQFPMVAKPLRLALTGKTESPSIYELIFLLSKDESLNRISRLCNILTHKN
ncbi:glutamate--tRNA ligase [candidate division TM6 bacterium RIFCSPHIGHO2_12_FULL_32_22]|nr:MAG: glutamate--tRNA ligase [candidate division TM6 bacterium RIFCSPHIGHO2_12_FULL_32_22]